MIGKMFICVGIFFIGIVVGFTLAALCVASKERDEYFENCKTR